MSVCAPGHEHERDREQTAGERERGALERLRGVRRRARDDGDRERRHQRDEICRQAERDEHPRAEARNGEQRDEDDGVVAGELADERADRDAHARDQHRADPAAIRPARIGEADHQRSTRDRHRLDQIAGRGADEQRDADTEREPHTPLQLQPFALEANRSPEDAPRRAHGAQRRYRVAILRRTGVRDRNPSWLRQARDACGPRDDDSEDRR